MTRALLSSSLGLKKGRRKKINPQNAGEASGRKKKGGERKKLYYLQSHKKKKREVAKLCASQKGGKPLVHFHVFRDLEREGKEKGGRGEKPCVPIDGTWKRGGGKISSCNGERKRGEKKRSFYPPPAEGPVGKKRRGERPMIFICLKKKVSFFPTSPNLRRGKKKTHVRYCAA